jgi:hypothetical protein
MYASLYDCSMDEDSFSVLAAHWTSDCQFLPAENFRRALKDFADPHCASGHQLGEVPVSYFHNSEDNLIDCLLFDDVPVDGFTYSVDFPQHQGVTMLLMPGSRWV